MPLDNETKTAVTEMVDELYEGLVEDHALRFWEGGIVRSAPTGAPPEFITVEIEGIYDESVHWRGVPNTPAVGDKVVVWENPITHRREILGASGATGTTGGSYCQKITVAICGGDFTTLGAAVIWIGALPAGQQPSATRLYVINVLGGTFVEAGDVTIPQYVHVSGEGEGSVIAMGVNTLIMSSDTSLQDIVVTSSDPVDALRANNAASIVLTNAVVIQSAAGICFNFTGTTSVSCFECIARATTGGTTGFNFANSATGHLFHCYVVDLINFTIAALSITSTAVSGIYTRYCAFLANAVGDDVVTGAGSRWYHLACHFRQTNSTLAAGTHWALPTTRFNQEVIVAEEGGDFQALSEAVTWINAQGDAAAGKLYGVFMLAGNFAEVGNVTIPQYVHVSGQGRGTEIEMGANVLMLSSNSSLKDVIVETTMDAATKYCVECNGATGYELFNVLVRYTPHTSGANIGFYFHGASSGAAYHCVAEPLADSATGTVSGFAAEDSAVVLLWDCEANDMVNLDYGLYIGDTANVTTKHCTFRAKAAGSDVYEAATAAWSHVATEVSPANVTLPGTVAFLPRVRDTVGCALAHSANQPVGSGAWPVALTFDTERWDDHQAMGGVGFHVGGAPTRITIPAGFGGRYTISGHVVFDGNPNGTERSAHIYLNGWLPIAAQQGPFWTGVDVAISVSTVYNLVAGDFVELLAYQDSGIALNVLTIAAYSPEFRIERK